MTVCQSCLDGDQHAYPVHHLPNPGESLQTANLVDHYFCSECLDNWLERTEHTTCPACARKITRLGNRSVEKIVLAVDPTDAELTARLSLHTYSVVIVRGNNLSDESIQRIWDSPNLSIVSLVGVSWRSRQLQNLPPHLNTLILQNCPRISGIVLDRLSPHLRVLIVTGCRRITNTAIGRFRANHPMCIIQR